MFWRFRIRHEGDHPRVFEKGSVRRPQMLCHSLDVLDQLLVVFAYMPSELGVVGG